MYLPEFEVLEPTSIHDACKELDRYKEKGVEILAGGTDFLVDIRPKIIRQHLPRCPGCPGTGSSVREPKQAPPYVVSITRIREIRGIETDETWIRIGSMVSIRELSESELIRDELKTLYDGAVQLGSPLVRNRGTIGGNIANARPAADTFVPSAALDAKLIVESVSGKREIPVSSFAKAPGVTVLEPTEFITHILFPRYSGNTGSSYIKLANRKALEIAVVGIASFIQLDDTNGSIKNARIAMGAVGPTPLLADTAMSFLKGKIPNEDIIRQASGLAVQDTLPINDHRGSKDYRLLQVEVLTRRTLHQAIRNAANNQSKTNK